MNHLIELHVKSLVHISNSANGCGEGAVLAVNEWALSTNPNARRGRFMSSSK